MIKIFEPDSQYILGSMPVVEHYQDAFATPFTRVNGTIRGAIYSKDGMLIESSRRISGIAGDRVVLSDPPEEHFPINGERLGGKTCYIGHIMNHYGHFITESLSNLWILKSEGASFDHYAVHPFIFGSGIAPFIFEAFSILGLNIKKLRIIDTAMVFDDIAIPSRAWIANYGAYSVSNIIFDIVSSPYRISEGKLKLYLSRREVLNRSISNESEIETLFQRAGFVVVHPELLPWQSQLALYGQSSLIAGFGGTAMHNLLFCPRGTPAIIIGDKRARDIIIPTQLACCSLRNSRAVLLPYAENEGNFCLDSLSKNFKLSLSAIGLS